MNVLKYKNLMLAAVALVVAIPLSSAQTAGMSERLRGKILLQVENNGEAWYVNPTTGRRHFLGRPTDAFNLLRSEGVGITDNDLKKIPVGLDGVFGSDTDSDGLSDLLEDAIGCDKSKTDSDGDGYNDASEIMNGYDPTGAGRPMTEAAFAKSQRGKIFLQVENHGEAWWVNPDDDHRYFLGRPADAFALMREFGLGITNADLSEIQEINSAVSSEIVKASETTSAGNTEFVTKEAPNLSQYYSACADNDLDCLIEFINSGGSGKVRVGREWTEDGIHSISRETWRFEPISGGRFSLSMITDDRLMEMDPVMKSDLLNLGTPLSELEKSESDIANMAANLTGSNKICVTDDRTKLADVITRWKFAAHSPADLDFAKCCLFNASGQTEPSLACDEDFPNL